MKESPHCPEELIVGAAILKLFSVCCRLEENVNIWVLLKTRILRRRRGYRNAVGEDRKNPKMLE